MLLDLDIYIKKNILIFNQLQISKKKNQIWFIFKSDYCNFNRYIIIYNNTAVNVHVPINMNNALLYYTVIGDAFGFSVDIM